MHAGRWQDRVPRSGAGRGGGRPRPVREDVSGVITDADPGHLVVEQLAVHGVEILAAG
ncbi:hypothetical protein [Kitasatospora camelliae]|uniref:Uncharacterized protein n=1 Tax=Kitasatospora camelliae TaxID=3156397 RepID=A0AAU8K8N0_9ACTN